MPEKVHCGFFPKTNDISRQSFKMSMISKEVTSRIQVFMCFFQSSFSFTWISREVALQMWHLHLISWQESLNYYEIPLK